MLSVIKVDNHGDTVWAGSISESERIEYCNMVSKNKKEKPVVTIGDDTVAGDFNGDGTTDLAVGQGGYDNGNIEGRAMVFYGTPVDSDGDGLPDVVENLLFAIRRRNPSSSIGGGQRPTLRSRRILP